MTDIEVRLECVRLASLFFPHVVAGAGAVPVSRLIYDFVTGKDA